MTYNLLKYSASWCQPCKQLTKALDSLNLPDGLLQEIDIDALGLKEVKLRGIASVPTMVLTKDGANVDSRTGYLSASEIKSWLSRNGVELG